MLMCEVSGVRDWSFACSGGHTFTWSHSVATETHDWEVVRWATAKVDALGEAARAGGYKGPERHVVVVGDDKV